MKQVYKFACKKKRVMVRKVLLLLLFVGSGVVVQAQLPDSVVMTVGGKAVSLSEFLYIARKNNGVDLSDEKALREYVELFRRFKLKIVEAERLGMDTTQAFYEEFNGYRTQLISGYLSEQGSGPQDSAAVDMRALEAAHPDMPHLIQEYRDGILLFDLSNARVWSHPLEKQDSLEREWLKELSARYPVVVNWSALRALGGHLSPR